MNDITDLIHVLDGGFDRVIKAIERASGQDEEDVYKDLADMERRLNTRVDSVLKRAAAAQEEAQQMHGLHERVDLAFADIEQLKDRVAKSEDRMDAILSAFTDDITNVTQRLDTADRKSRALETRIAELERAK